MQNASWECLEVAAGPLLCGIRRLARSRPGRPQQPAPQICSASIAACPAGRKHGGGPEERPEGRPPPCIRPGRRRRHSAAAAAAAGPRAQGSLEAATRHLGGLQLKVVLVNWALLSRRRSGEARTAGSLGAWPPCRPHTALYGSGAARRIASAARSCSSMVPTLADPSAASSLCKGRRRGWWAAIHAVSRCRPRGPLVPQPSICAQYKGGAPKLAGQHKRRAASLPGWNGGWQALPQHSAVSVEQRRRAQRTCYKWPNRPWRFVYTTLLPRNPAATTAYISVLPALL